MTNGITRRVALGAMAAPAIIGLTRGARADTRTLKISHQFPGSNGDTGDFRDRICRKFAEEVEKRSKGALKFEIYPNASLMKTFAQFDALKKGALDLSLYPTTYAGGEIPELNITFMPAVVTSYEQGYRWKKAPIGQEMMAILEAKGVKLLTWMWQSGGIASRGAPIVKPDDAKGLKIRGGSREMDMMFKGAGAATSNMPSNEIYISMQTGAIDAAATEFHQDGAYVFHKSDNKRRSRAQMVALYRRLAAGAEGIVSVHISQKLSGTYNSAILARDSLPGDCRIEVIDSGSGSMGLGLIAIQAARAAQAGAGIDDVVKQVGNAMSRTHFFGMVDTLEYLHKGGRIGKAQTMLGTLLSIKPILYVREGEIHPLGKERTRKRALSRLLQIIEEYEDIKDITVLHSTTPEDAEALIEKIAARLGLDWDDREHRSYYRIAKEHQRKSRK